MRNLEDGAPLPPSPPSRILIIGAAPSEGDKEESCTHQREWRREGMERMGGGG